MDRCSSGLQVYLANWNVMTVLTKDIAAFDQLRRELEGHSGEWAVFYCGEFVGLFPEFEAAASEAVERFGSGPYLIRQIGAETIQISAATVFRPAHAHGPGRV